MDPRPSESSRFNIIEPPKKDFHLQGAWEICERIPRNSIPRRPQIPPKVDTHTQYDLASGPARYVVEEKPRVGSGGLSHVYKGWDRRLGRFVAVKRLHPGWFEDKDPHIINGIELEAKTMTRLNHPAIPQIYDFMAAPGPDGLDIPLFIMQYVQGIDLLHYMEVQHQLLGKNEIMRVVTQTAAALDAASRHGLYHGDIKPSNILLTKPWITIVDFGSSNWAFEEGTITPGYSAPEAYAGTRDSGSEEYSLAATAYFIVCDEIPSNPEYFDGRTIIERFGESGKTLQSVFKKALAVESKNRYQTPSKFAEEFCNAVKQLPLKS